ncbi:ABC transporter substrate-binding protein [Paenibacillus filicis]|uniref:ABC transporter substrate-binding protein n=1 Tax=Paenibacillus gyeongsangnamensis TaxID=3388067 RepID=A0ABT4QKE6_9BACL|nr:ABC transporter substrate-binding protein [Paenibacillus filicis]MCZ8517332.1 ABC transporter substrate-binding protein [Paenibacillus filicis]
MAIKKTSVTILFIIFLLSVVLAGCTSQSSPKTGNSTGETKNSTSEPKKGGTLKVAIAGEPPSLDVQITSAFLSQEIGWHIYEGLFTLDDKYNAVPLLAKDYNFDMATNTYVIHLREGIKFHNGKVMTADDVIASLNRWGKKSSYGAIFFNNVKELKMENDLTLDIILKTPQPNVPMLLAFPNQQAAIYPKEIIDAAGDGPIKDFIGTGPYRFVEHVPDQHVKLSRYDDYKPLPGSANGMGGSRVAYVDNIMFIPTPEVSTRLDGVQTGQFDYAEQISTDLYESMKANNQVDAVIVKPYWWPQAVFNKKTGPFKDQRMRQAFALALNMEPIMKAAFTSSEFYRIDPSLMFQEQKQWWTDAGKEMYNQGNIEKAQQLMKEAGYNREPIRWLTTKDYDFMYKISLVATEQLKKAGFNIDLQVVDWATLIQKRANPDLYEVFMGATTFTPDPGIWPVFDSKWPGFWENSNKDALLKSLNSEMDPAKRKAIWDKLQAITWDQVPVVKFGDFFLLGTKSKKLQGLQGTPFPYYWNVWLNQ